MAAPSKSRRVSAEAPASIGNLAVGFDILGLAFPLLKDRVTVSLREDDAVVVSFGNDATLPSDPEKNTASRALLALRKDVAPETGFDIEIVKGIPLAAGLGGSAASAAAAIAAADSLLDLRASLEDRVRWAVHGEEAASGARHADNVAPSLMGGLVLSGHGTPLKMQLPRDLGIAVALPDIEVRTSDARAMLSESCRLDDHVAQTESLARLILACERDDADSLAGLFDDRIIEHQRAALVPGLLDAQNAARKAGALGASLSGSGPTVFAIARLNRLSEVETALGASLSRSEAPARTWSASAADLDVGAEVSIFEGSPQRGVAQ